MNEQEITRLITKILANEASAEEQRLVDQWRAGHADNDLQFKQIRLIWDNIPQAEETDTDAAWERFSAQLHAPKKVFRLNTYLRIAAAVVFIGIGSLLLGRLWLGRQVSVQTASNEVKEVTLPDGSVAWLNHDSKLEYARNFKGDIRSVQLSGEAFFEVVKNPEKPFVITTPHAVTTVLGTSFNLADHNNAAEATLTVATGKVSFVSAAGHNEVVVTANESARIDAATGAASKDDMADLNSMGWKTRKLSFRDTPLPDVFKSLERYYNINIKTDNQGISKCHFTGEFTDPSFRFIMDAICKSLQLSYEQKGKNVTVSGKGCN
jgi:transmembrane sensor